MNHRFERQDLLTLLLGSLILSGIAFFNGYPLVYSDTGTYIKSAFELKVPADRSIIYSLFIRAVTWKFSLWPVVYFQSLFLSTLLLGFLKAIGSPAESTRNRFLFISGGLTLFTGLGWYSGQIMPDIFAPATIIAFFLVFRAQSFGKKEQILFFMLLAGSMMMHSTHLFVGLALCLGLVGLQLLTARISVPKPGWKPIRRLTLAAALAWIMVPATHSLFGGPFETSPGAHAFMMAHFEDNGSLKAYLKRHCHEPEFEICLYCRHQDETPLHLAEFLWSPKSPFNLYGGWNGTEGQNKFLLNKMLPDPRFLLQNLSFSLRYGLTQITRFDIGDGLSGYNEGSAPNGEIQMRLGREYQAYRTSLQNLYGGTFQGLKHLNLLHWIIIMGSTLFLIMKGKILLSQPEWKWAFLILIGGLALNAFLTAGLNSPTPRFQCRVVWLLPLLAANLWLFVRDKQKTDQKNSK